MPHSPYDTLRYIYHLILGIFISLVAILEWALFIYTPTAICFCDASLLTIMGVFGILTSLSRKSYLVSCLVAIIVILNVYVLFRTRYSLAILPIAFGCFHIWYTLWFLPSADSISACTLSKSNLS